MTNSLLMAALFTHTTPQSLIRELDALLQGRIDSTPGTKALDFLGITDAEVARKRRNGVDFSALETAVRRYKNS